MSFLLIIWVFTFAVLTVTWRLKWINLIGIYRIDLSYSFVYFFNYCRMVCDVVLYNWFGVKNKRRRACDLFHTLLIFFSLLLPHRTQQLVIIFLFSHSHIICCRFFFCFCFSGWKWLVRIGTHAFHRFTSFIGFVAKFI